MKISFWKKTASAVMAFLLVTGSIPAVPVSELMKPIAFTANAEGEKTESKLSTNSAGAYLIQSADDFKTFADMVNDGNSFAGKVVILENDIELSKDENKNVFVGTETMAFQGTFDGYEHTITVHYDNTETYTAPFAYVENAVIKNLRISGSIASTQNNTSGLVGAAKGITKIQNCIVDAEISTASGTKSNAGFVSVAFKESNVTLTDCLFQGKFSSENNNAEFAGLVYLAKSNLTFKNCYFNPKEITQSFKATLYVRDNDNSRPITVENCYHNNTLAENGDAQGSQIAPSPSDVIKLLKGWTFNSNSEPIPFFNNFDLSNAEIYGLQSLYIYDENNSVNFSNVVVKDFYGETLTKDTDYTLSVKNEDGVEQTGSVNAKGTYTVEIVGKKNTTDETKSYSGTKIFTFSITSTITYKKYSLNDNGELTSDSVEVTDFIPLKSSDATLTAKKTYIVCGDVTINQRIVANNNKLILCDGATLHAPRGIETANGTFTIYGQENNTGRLVIDDVVANCAGIGGGKLKSDNKVSPTSASNIEIYGGTINVKGGQNSAGIGARNANKMGNVTIYGGNIITTGGANGAGIGGGQTVQNDFNINIYGGTIYATAGSKAAAIGDGKNTYRSNVQIYGGDITAVASEEAGAGIGGGLYYDLKDPKKKENVHADGGTIGIHGGTVRAEGGDGLSDDGYGCSAIGGDYATSAGAITIDGGTVIAHGGENALGDIGSWSEKGGDTSSVTITGGQVTAVSSSNSIYSSNINVSFKNDSDFLNIKKISNNVTIPDNNLLTDGKHLFIGAISKDSYSGETIKLYKQDKNNIVPTADNLQIIINNASVLGFNAEKPIQLKQNIELSSPLTIPEGTDLTIDLNGYNLYRTLQSAEDNGNIINNNGTLKITDNSQNAEKGEIYGGNNNSIGGAIDNAGTLTIENITLRDNTSIGCGGAVYNKENAVLTLKNAVLKNNSSENGGAVYSNSGQDIQLENVVFSENTATAYGGAVYIANQTATIKGCQFTDNSANNTNGMGGAIYCFKTNITFEQGDNEKNNIFSNNTAYYGGGIYFDNCLAEGFSLNNLEMKENSAQKGGAVYLNNNNVNISGVIISENTATQDGGGIYANSGNVYFKGSPYIYENSGGDIIYSDTKLSFSDALTANAKLGFTIPENFNLTIFDAKNTENELNSYIQIADTDEAKYKLKLEGENAVSYKVGLSLVKQDENDSLEFKDGAGNKYLYTMPCPDDVDYDGKEHPVFVMETVTGKQNFSSELSPSYFKESTGNIITPYNGIPKEAGTYTILFEIKDNNGMLYKLSRIFTIKECSITDKEFNQVSLVYNTGTKPLEEIPVSNDLIMKNDTDFDYDSLPEFIPSEQPYTLSFTGKGNFTGTNTLYVNVTAKPFKHKDITAELLAEKFSYDGKDISEHVIVKDKGTALTYGEDYTITPKIEKDNLQAVGTHTIIITGKGNYSGTVELTYTVEKADVSLSFKDKITKDYDEQEFTLSELCEGNDDVTKNLLSDENTIVELRSSNGEKIISAGEYQDAVLTISNSNFNTFTKKLNVTINQVKPTIIKTPELTSNNLAYTGDSMELITDGKCDGGKFVYYLIQPEDYNTDKDTPPMIGSTLWTETIPTAKDTGKYKIYYYLKGDINHLDQAVESLSLEITKVKIKSENISLSFEGKKEEELMPVVTVNSRTLKLNEDYTLVHNDNKFTVTGITNYIGTVSVSYTHKKAVEVTCTKSGNLEYWAFRNDKYIKENDIFIKKQDVVIPAPGHVRSTYIQKVENATYSKPGYGYQITYCPKCGKVFKKIRINYPKLQGTHIPTDTLQ